MDRSVTLHQPAWAHLEWPSEDTVLLHFDGPLEPDTAARIAGIASVLRAGAPTWLLDLTGGFGKLLVHYRADLVTDTALLALLHKAATKATHASTAQPSQVTIPVCYDPRVAPDLGLVAERLGLSIDAVVDLHQGATYQVLAVGFALGFAYLGGLPESLKLPRKSTPAMRVPAGSVAIAETQTTIYPIETPGGWHIIGKTHHQLVSRGTSIDLSLPMGAQVRFESISFAQLQNQIEPR